MKKGIYGEMPKIELDKHTISMMSDNKDEKRVWIINEETGEAGEFQAKSLEKYIEKFWKENF